MFVRWVAVEAANCHQSPGGALELRGGLGRTEKQRMSFPNRLETEDILSELYLESMVAQFRREWIVSSVILALKEKQVERLGVSAIGDRVRLRLLRGKFGENSAETSTGGGNVATSSERPSADAIR